jgi:protease-4
MNFFKTLLAVLVGLILFSIISIFFFIGLISVTSAEPEVTVKDNSVLHLRLDRPIEDRGFSDPFSDLPGLGLQSNTYGIIRMKEVLREAAEDDRIKGIYLESPVSMSGSAIAGELRDALSEFKESGKFIVSFAELYSEGGYYIASVADEVYTTQTSALEFNGLAAEMIFLKGTLDKLGVEPQIFRVGDFKSAVEPFTNSEMSPENEIQTQQMVDGIYSEMLTKIAESRAMSFEELKNISDQMLVTGPRSAVEHNLIDGIRYYDEVESIMKEKIGLSEDDDINYITYNKYKKAAGTEGSGRDRIAVIVASGEIFMGGGSQGIIGSADFVKELRNARESSSIKAVVLRINSPGGSAIASDVLWREIQKTREVKPVIASLSDYAASGGYYMAMACDTIVAQPNTITGSIGVFATLFNMKEMLNDKLGITFDVAKTGEFSDIFTIVRPLSAVEKSKIQVETEWTYETFVSKASEGRNMSKEELLKVASGRVWLGSKAQELGLVDIVGDFEDAVEIAAAKAGIEEYKLRFYPQQKTFLEEFLANMEQNARVRMLKSELGEAYPYYKSMQKALRMEGIQARLPYELKLY